MENVHPPAEAVIRVNFRVAVAVNPLLATDLQRFTLGKSRHARLTALAMIGLMSEKRRLDGGTPAPMIRGETTYPQPGKSDLKAQLADHDFAEIGE